MTQETPTACLECGVAGGEPYRHEDGSIVQLCAVCLSASDIGHQYTPVQVDALVILALPHDVHAVLEQLAAKKPLGIDSVEGLLRWFGCCAADGFSRSDSWERGWLVQACGEFKWTGAGNTSSAVRSALARTALAARDKAIPSA